ncbi:unnamed protein product [Cylicocyclus nassatus]|uniref:Uncharacterized protein n=1 Tax=Cylicocyclus nassatus TaxID=53992 RepID=A0AA36MF00_CYLNA|nr:unnamed protein product [Cylicocyclus nassatus]
MKQLIRNAISVVFAPLRPNNGCFDWTRIRVDDNIKGFPFGYHDPASFKSASELCIQNLAKELICGKGTLTLGL